MKTALIFFGLLLGCAYAAEPAHYQDGVLVSFRTVTTGSSCSGSVHGSVDRDGSVDGHSHSSCSDETQRYYTVKTGDQTFVITPAGTRKGRAAAMATLGWSAILFSKGSVLRNQIPGAHILVRSDASGVWVKVGKRESVFSIVDAQ